MEGRKESFHYIRVMKFTGQLSRLTMLCLLAMSFMISSCKTIVVVDRPEESYNEKKSYDKQISAINVPIEIPVEELEAQINKYMTGVLYEDKSFSNNDGDNLKCKVKKYSPFKLFAEDDRLMITMPLDISGSYTKLGAVINFKGTVKATYMTTITLLDGWKLKTVTKSYGYTWIKSPEVDLGWVDVPVQWLVDKILSDQDKEINKLIDEAVQDYVDLNELVKPAFAALSSPINVSEEYNSWFKIEPIEAFTTPLKFVNKNLNITLGMKAYTETFIGKPAPSRDSLRTIPMRVSQQLPGDFNMELVTIMPYADASQVMYDEFVTSGYEYVEGKYHISFTKMGIFGQNGKLVIEVGMLGSVKGDIYLIGDPYYDSTSRTIRMQNLDFDFKSKQALLKSADWLAHGKLCKVMEKNMYFEIGAELDAAKKDAQEYLNDYQPVPGVILNGSLDELETSNVYLIRDAMVIVVNAKGSLSVKVKGLE